MFPCVRKEKIRGREVGESQKTEGKIKEEEGKHRTKGRVREGREIEEVKRIQEANMEGKKNEEEERRQKLGRII